MLTLYASQGSVAVAAHVALEEAGLPYTIHWISINQGEQRSLEFLAINPKGRLPALLTEYGHLTETPAILDYIADISDKFLPSDPFQKARARELISFLAATVHVNHAHGPRAARWSDDPAAQVSMAAKVAETMADSCGVIEAVLPDAGWFLGSYCIADIHLYAVCRWLEGDGVAIANYPKLAAHFAAMKARPAVAKVAALHG
jgi:glutathione S-transferase